MIFGRQALINIKVFVMTRTKENRRNIEVYFGCSFTYFESFWHLFDTFIDLFLSIYIHYHLLCSAYQPNSFPLTFLYIFFIILPKQSLIDPNDNSLDVFFPCFHNAKLELILWRRWRFGNKSGQKICKSFCTSKVI